MGVKESGFVLNICQFYSGHHSETLLKNKKNAMNTESKYKNPPWLRGITYNLSIMTLLDITQCTGFFFCANLPQVSTWSDDIYIQSSQTLVLPSLHPFSHSLEKGMHFLQSLSDGT